MDLTLLVASPWFGLIGFIATVIGTYVAIKYIPIKRISYSTRSFRVVNLIDRDDLLEISYENEKIEKLTLTGIAIWNSGNQPINYQSDIDTVEGVKICLKSQGKILKPNLLDKQANGFDCTKNGESELIIHFSLLNKNQGGSVQILHTGELDENLIELNGTIAGGSIRRVPYSHSRANTPINQIALTSSFVAAVANFFLFLVFYSQYIIVPDSSSTFAFMIVFTVILNFILIWMLDLFLDLRIAKIPKQFKKFHDQSKLKA
jgi:hypothetical protein